MAELRKKITTLRRAEWHRRRGRERARKRAAFIPNPFGFTKKILRQKKSGHLACTEDKVNNYLSATYTDSVREGDLGPCRTLITPPEPTTAFNITEPTLKEVEVVVQASKTSSAPGPSGDLAVLWLDLANAYGSFPHKLVETSLDRYHVPGKIKDLILDYYSCFSLRVTSGTKISTFHRLEKGIITRCTISVILFTLAINMLVKSAEVECRGPLTNSGMRQPPIRAFMDDLTGTITSVPGCPARS